jgi:GxxExxY protein
MHLFDLVHRQLTDRIIRAFFDVHNELGHGFSEAVLQRAMVLALTDAGLTARADVRLDAHFRGRCVGQFTADIVVEDTVLVEVKATEVIHSYARPQLLNYLKAAGGGVGLILCFGHTPKFERMVMGDPRNSLPRLQHRRSSGGTPTDSG